MILNSVRIKNDYYCKCKNSWRGKFYNLFIYLFLIIKGKTAIVNHIYGETLFLYN